jgi:hypothetical protein
MSWLAANWYSVFAPAIAGIAFWLIAHRIIGNRQRHDRQRDARKLGDFQLLLTSRR